MSNNETKTLTSLKFNVKRSSNTSNNVLAQNGDKPRKTNGLVIKKTTNAKQSFSHSTQRFLFFGNRLMDFHNELQVKINFIL